MPTHVRCPLGHKLMVPSRYAGRTIACPKCNMEFTIPAAAAAPATPSAPPTTTAPAAPVTVKSTTKPAAKTAAPAEKKAVEKKVTPPPAAAPAPRKKKVAATTETTTVTSGTLPEEPAIASEPTAAPVEVLIEKADIVTASAALPSPPPTSALSVPPPPPARVAPPRPGMQHPPHRLRAVYFLSVSIAAVAVFAVVPACLDVVDYFRTGKGLGVSAWAFALFFLSLIQCGYALYLAQLPDWSSTRVVTVMILGLTMLYAMLLGSLMLGSERSWIVETLQLTDQLRNARLWCFLMLSLTSLIAYFAGRIVVRWKPEAISYK